VDWGFGFKILNYNLMNVSENIFICFQEKKKEKKNFYN
jgi:hypothetical protein